MAERPTVNQIGDSLTFDYHRAQIHIVLDRFREARGDLWAQATWRTSAPGMTPDLHQSRWNLCSMSQRDVLIRRLRARYEGPDWHDIVERTARLALEIWRAGEPVVMVGRMDRVPGPAYLVDPFLVQNEVNMIYGDEATGKSFTAIALALTVQEDIPVLDLGAAAVRPVLYVDYETTAEEIDQRVKMVARGAGVEPAPEIAYLRGVGVLADRAAEIAAKVATVQPGLVIVDSVGYACGAVEGTSDWSGPFLRMTEVLRGWRTTVLLIDHAGEDRPYGTRYKMFACRNVWKTKKVQEAGERILHLGFYNQKQSNAALHRSLGYRLEFDPDGQQIHFRREDLLDVPELAQGLSAWVRIRAMLARGAMRAPVIAEELGIPQSSARRVLREHYMKGQVDEREGLWFLISDREEPRAAGEPA